MTDIRTIPVRFSALKAMGRSALHYRHAVQEGWDESLPMRIGAGVHAILFGTPYAIWTGKVRNGKAWEAFEDEHVDQTILNARELAEAQNIVHAITDHREAADLLFNDDAVTEQQIAWKLLGRDCLGQRH